MCRSWDIERLLSKRTTYRFCNQITLRYLSKESSVCSGIRNTGKKIMLMNSVDSFQVFLQRGQWKFQVLKRLLWQNNLQIRIELRWFEYLTSPMHVFFRNVIYTFLIQLFSSIITNSCMFKFWEFQFNLVKNLSLVRFSELSDKEQPEFSFIIDSSTKLGGRKETRSHTVHFPDFEVNPTTSSAMKGLHSRKIPK